MTLLKSACVTLAVGACVFLSGPAHADMVSYQMAANAPAHCQAFTPGPANTIRNRVVGAENVGSAPMNVACTFEKINNQGGTTFAAYVLLYFSNNGTAQMTVTCTLLSGFQGMGGAIVLNKSVNVTAGSQSSLQFSAMDTADPSDATLGNDLVGVNCTLPPNAVINDTYVGWSEENGVGT